jgi:DnaJ domain
LRTHYELLGVGAGAPSDEVKRAFRREIARYHPDKVQHLGPEFQQIAATRASELTEAYRVLMNPAARESYDALLASGGATPSAQAPASPGSTPTATPARTSEESRPRAEPAVRPLSESLRETRATMSGVVRKATINRLRQVVELLAGAGDTAVPSGFDAAFVLTPRRGLFQKGEPTVQVLARMVDRVDAAAVAEVWPIAMRLAKPDLVGCVLLLGLGLAPPPELAAAIADQRRKSRQAAVPVLVPVDTRDWDALVPPETPSMVRTLLERLKLGG